MATPGRHPAAATGHPSPGFRNRDESGFPSIHLHHLAELVGTIGEPCHVSGPTAAALHRFDGFRLRPPFHVVVPRGRNLQRIGHVVHTSLYLPTIDLEEAHGLPVTAPARTLIDIAVHASRDELAAAFDGALRDGLFSERWLHERIDALRSQGRYGVPRLLAAIDAAEIGRGSHSWLEREYLRLLAAAGLPTPTTQVVLGRRGDSVVRVDFHFTGTPVVVEVLGYRWHRTTAQMDIDAQRYNELLLNGFIPVQFTYQQVVHSPDAVIATTARALAPFH